MFEKPPDNRPPPAHTLTRGRVTRPPVGPTISRVSKGWPFEDFGAYMRALMDAAGIANYAELSRLTGVSQHQFSNWRRGIAQPSRANLKRIFDVLGLKSPVTLYVAAGLDTTEDLALEATPDFTVLPKPFHDLREVYERMEAIGRGDKVLESIETLVLGLRAQLSQIDQGRKGHPSGRRRVG